MGCFEDLVDLRRAVERLEKERRCRRAGKELEGIAVEREKMS